jgi:hypothetical protein
MLKAYLLGFLVLLTESIGAILILVIASNYDSPYFICAMSASQFSLALLIAYNIYIWHYNRKILKFNSYPPAEVCSNMHIYYHGSTNSDNLNSPNSQTDRIDQADQDDEQFNKFDETDLVDHIDAYPENTVMYVPINSSVDDKINNESKNNKFQYFEIFITGVLMAVSSLLFVYSANPERTPIILQIVLSGLNIIYSCLLTHYYLKKDIKYNQTYCILSIVTLMLSIGISIIPIDDFNFSSIGWPIMYIFSQILRVAGNITQEKCLMSDDDYSTKNKFRNIAYSRFIQFVATLLFFWLELVIGYGSSFDSLKDSLSMVKNADIDFILLEIYIVSAVLFCIFNGYLNFISTNYTTVALTLVSPVVGVFFSIFTQLDNGTHYPIYITIPALALNLLSSYFWAKGEKY